MREKMRAPGLAKEFAKSTQPKEGEVIAVIDRKYRDRPQLGKVTATTATHVKIDWLISSYWSSFKPYRKSGKVVTASILMADVPLRNVALGKNFKLDKSTQLELRSLYENVK